jgi:hypothetical protein
MKKLVFASVMALASVSLVSAPTLRAQQDSITIKDPAEFNAYQMFNTQSDPKTKAAAGESFLTAYPQSVVKSAVLDGLIDAYQAVVDDDRALGAATRLLQVDPNNMKAILVSVLIKRKQCTRSHDAQTCDDGAALARKGLGTPQPTGTSNADWKKQTGQIYPIFHSAIAWDQVFSKKDIKAGIEEFRQELMLFPPEQTTSGTGLVDTLQLAESYATATPPDPVNAVWFYARAWNFAPPSFKPAIEKKLDYWYNKYHGKLDGLEEVKGKAAATVFPSGEVMTPAPTPAERIHTILVNTPDLRTLNLGDKELVLAYGAKEDADKLWGVMKDQQTPVPGLVMEANVTGMKVVITQAAKASDFLVSLRTPMACGDVPGSATTVAALKNFILTNGVKDDTDKIEAISPDNKKPITKITVEGTVSLIKLAVSGDAKDAKTPDFIVNLKEPAPCKEVPAVGSDFGMQSKGETELDGTYDTYRQVAATSTAPQAAEIVLREGFIQAEKKKAAPVHKPAAGHRPAAHAAH